VQPARSTGAFGDRVEREDERQILFASERAGGLGSFDIYFATR
jgi:hypothetical protein